jgi:hypothetical protein
MSIISTLKELTNLMKKVDDIPLQRQIMELHGEVMSLYEDNTILKQENERLLKALKSKGKLKVGNKHLWEVTKKDEVIGGPYCITCWERAQEVISMVSCKNLCDIQCPVCRIPLLPQKAPEKFEQKAYA